MNCEIYQTQLEDFLYGELDASTSAALREHVSVCANCRQAQAVLEHEAEIFTQFYEQNALEPSDEMWANIHARIKDDKPQPQSSWNEPLRNWLAPFFAPAFLRQAGFAALLILISVGATALYFSSRDTESKSAELKSPTPTVTPTSTPSPTASPLATAAPPKSFVPAPKLENAPKPQFAALKNTAPNKVIAVPKLSDEQMLSAQIAKASREYQGAIKLLERAVAKRKSDLDEGAIKQFEGSLALIDASIASSRQALRAHPNDPAAAKYLLAAYSKKVELMQEIAMR